MASRWSEILCHKATSPDGLHSIAAAEGRLSNKPLLLSRGDGQIRFASDQAGRAVEWRDVMRPVHEVTGRSSGDVW